MGKYQGYERYKDSGVEWLGEIPESWEIVRFSHFITFQEGPGIMAADFRDEGIPLLRIHNLKPGFVDLEGCNYLDPEKVEKTWKHFKLKRNDILISCSASTGLISIVDEKSENSIAYTGIIRLNPARCEINRQFIQVLVGSDLFFTQIDLLKTGTTIQHYGPVHLRQIKITLPPLEEQETIAQFLDHKTSQIDALISKKEALLQKLDEKRTALISHAVTKGLDPTVPMKDSGIEWLGDIPAHWEQKRLKYVASITRGAILRPVNEPSYFDENGEWYYLNISDVTKCEKFLYSAELKLSDLGSYKSARVLPNNLILTASATIGKPIINKVKVCIHDGFIAFKDILINIFYLFYILLDQNIYSAMGKTNTQKNIYLDEVKNITIGIPTPKEQQKIVKYLDQQTTKIEQQKAKIQQAINLLKEYRTALITNAVTGKIDVRQVPIPQP